MRGKSRHDKRDQNEAGIIKELKKIPQLSVEEGHDDILVGYKGITYWFEIKNPERLTKKGELTAANNSKTYQKQKKLSEEFKGHYKIVFTLEEILAEIGVIR